MSLDEYQRMKKLRWQDPDSISMEEKKAAVCAAKNKDETNVDRWLEFLQFEASAKRFIFSDLR